MSGTEDLPTQPKRKKKLKNPKKNVRRLVSYNDTIVSDGEGGVDQEEEEDDEESEEGDEEEDDVNSSIEADATLASQSIDPDDRSKTGDFTGSSTTTGGDSGESKDERSRKDTDRWAKYGFSLPPEPKGKCAVELQDKINLLYEKMKHTQMDMNRVIQERKEFRNPSIYEKLIQFCDINEFGTNYPPEIYDPLQWGAESFYEELAKTQKVDMDKREKDRKDNSKVELALAAAKKVEEEAKRRKSKWDQPGPSSGTVAAAGGGSGTTSIVTGTVSSGSVKAAGLVQPALTTNITGTKGTVISAFGSLPKKPKV